MDELTGFRGAFEALTGNQPFPWQEDLFLKWFSQTKFPLSCNLPTGLGKTSVVAIWLIALAKHPEKMPRRLVYVVNRRTVVDQTTEEVIKCRRRIAALDETNRLKHQVGSLAISTLRGQFADNREWSADPIRPAVIVGTVDMIGSRLLFSGYGVGFKTKPLHAGFLGQDVLVAVVDNYVCPASTWASVTPVILPGHDDHKPQKTRKLIEKALQQSGIDQPCEFEWSAVSQFPKSLSAHKYDRKKRPTGCIRPDHLLSQTAVHMKIRFNEGLIMPGPLAIGSGRHCGLGLFAAVSE